MSTLNSAYQYAKAGKIEEWIHLFLNCEGDNVPFSEGLRLKKRYYFGPLKFKLDMFTRCCGPDGTFELNDGNHRYEALRRSGVDEYYFIVWTTSKLDAFNFNRKFVRYSPNYEM